MFLQWQSTYLCKCWKLELKKRDTGHLFRLVVIFQWYTLQVSNTLRVFLIIIWNSILYVHNRKFLLYNIKLSLFHIWGWSKTSLGQYQKVHCYVWSRKFSININVFYLILSFKFCLHYVFEFDTPELYPVLVLVLMLSRLHNVLASVARGDLDHNIVLLLL